MPKNIVIKQSLDLNQSLQELEQVDWGEPTYDSHLVMECHRLRRIPLCKFTTENLRILIGQNESLEYLIPFALERLQKQPLASGDYFKGDLLTAVVRVNAAFWKHHPDLHTQAIEIVRRVLLMGHKKKQKFFIDEEFLRDIRAFLEKS